MAKAQSAFQLGVHISIAGSIALAPGRAKKLGCNTMQIFSRSPRQWRKGDLPESEIKAFRAAVQKEKISPVVVHVPYTLNLAAAQEKFYRITIQEFSADLVEVDRLGVAYLVTHPGSHKDLSEAEGVSRVVNALAEILNAVPKAATMLLLENTAGAGQWLGSKFAQLKEILKGIDFSPRVGLCLDTAHAWGAGYAIDTPAGFDAMLKEIDHELGLDRLKVVHLNDTQVELASHLDRHAHIGEGKIGRKGFQHIVNHPALKNAVLIMETPKESDADDLRNLKLVEKLRRSGKA